MMPPRPGDVSGRLRGQWAVLRRVMRWMCLPMAAVAAAACSEAPRQAFDVAVDPLSFRALHEDGSIWVDPDVTLALRTRPALPDDCSVEAQLDGHGAVTSQRSPIPDGTRLEFEVPARKPGPRRLDLTLCGTKRRLQLQIRPPAGALAGMAEAEKLHREDKLEGALRLLREQSPIEPWQRVQYATAAAMFQMRSGSPVAADAWLHAAETAKRAGFVSEQVRAVVLAVHAALNSGSVAKAAGNLEHLLATPSGSHPKRPLWVAHYSARLALQTGRFLEALAQIDRAVEASEQIAAGGLRCLLMHERAVIRFESGQTDEALAELAQARACDLQERPDDSEARWVFHNNRAWFSLVRHVGDTPPERADQIRQDLGVALVAAADASDSTEQANILGNLAWLEVLSGRHADAKHALQRAAALDSRSRSRAGHFVAFVAALEARARADYETALKLLREALRRAPAQSEDTCWFQLRMLTLAAHADVLATAGQVQAALSAYADTLSELRRGSRQTLLLGGRDRFFSLFRPMLQRYVALLLANGRHAQAMFAIERAREQTMAGLATRQRLEALVPEARTRLLSLREQLVQLRERRRKLEAARPAWPDDLRASKELDLQRLVDREEAAFEKAWALVEGAPPPAAVDANTLPLGEQEAFVLVDAGLSAGRIFWAVGQGPVRSQPLQASAPPEITTKVEHVYIAFGGHPLAATLAMDALSGSYTASFVPSSDWLRTALQRRDQWDSRDVDMAVFADPTLDLPHARAEGKEVAAVRTATLHSGREASRTRLVAALARPGLVHFAGHMRPPETAGTGESLLLANRERLGVTDLVSTSIRAGLVVLSACGDLGETALTDPNTLALAEVMLGVGAVRVVAPLRTVGDRESRSFMAAFHKQLSEGKRPVDAFHTVQRQRLREGLSVDAYRYLGLR